MKCLALIVFSGTLSAMVPHEEEKVNAVSLFDSVYAETVICANTDVCSLLKWDDKYEKWDPMFLEDMKYFKGQVRKEKKLHKTKKLEGIVFILNKITYYYCWPLSSTKNELKAILPLILINYLSPPQGDKNE